MSKGRSLGRLEAGILMALGGILVFVLVYLFVFTKLQDTTKNIKASNKTLQVEVNDLNEKKKHKKEYEDDIERMNKEVKKMLKAVPSHIEEEDEVMFARNLELEHEIYVKAINMNPNLEVYALNQSGANPTDAGKVLRQNTVTLNCTTDYDSLKSLINGLRDSEKRVAIEQISITSSDDADYLEGGVILNMYYLDGSDAPYVPEDIPSVPMTTPNIFGVK